MSLFLDRDASIKMLHEIRQSEYPNEYDRERHRLQIFDETGSEKLGFRLPVHLLNPEEVSSPVNYIILMVQSESCAVGYFENEINKDHKVFRAYSVRKKQGKSQIKYLKTRGKSKAGSRVRLASTYLFFENINERLQYYFKEHTIDRIAFSCSKILIPYLFNAKAATPFDKNDKRILKIPKHIHTPDFEAMISIQKYLLKGELIPQEGQEDFARELLGKMGRK